MAQLQSTNIAGTLTVNGIAVGGGKDFKYCCFTGSTTWIPTSDLVDGNGVVDSVLVGGGGGGGGALTWHCIISFAGDCGIVCCRTLDTLGGNGGGGMVYIPTLPITSTSTCTVTVGAGGSGGYFRYDASCTDTNTICTTDYDIAENGGTTIFGGINILGGGGGASIAKGSKSNWCAYQNQWGSQGGGTVQRGGGERNTSGGSSYMESNEITIQNAEDNTFSFLTGSGNIYNFTTCGRGITLDNGITFGAGAGQDLLGGTLESFVTSSGTVADPNKVGKVYGFGECLTPAVTTSAYDSRFKGSGGLGGCSQSCTRRTEESTNSLRGANGIDGIVIIKWFE